VLAVLDAQRVVEVARGLGIDRAEPAVAQIDTNLTGSAMAKTFALSGSAALKVTNTNYDVTAAAKFNLSLVAAGTKTLTFDTSAAGTATLLGSTVSTTVGGQVVVAGAAPTKATFNVNIGAAASKLSLWGGTVEATGVLKEGAQDLVTRRKRALHIGRVFL